MKVLSFPKKNLGAHATLLVFKKYKYQSPGTRSLNSVSGTTLTREELGGSAILLPLPKEIKDSFSVKIGEFSQGMFGDAISQGSSYMFNGGPAPTMDGMVENMGLPTTQSVVGAASTIIGGALSFLTSRTPGGAAIGGVVGSQLDAGTIAGSIEAGAGATVNPKQALQFKGIDLKTHNFSWTMAPTTFDESDTIRDIGNVVRRNALPSYASVGSLRRAFLSYPSTVDIYFFGIDQQYFMHFKTCMIDNFSFNYSPNGMAVMRGGKPAMVNMAISLKEMDIHTAEDYGGSGRNMGEGFTDAVTSIGGVISSFNKSNAQ